MKKFNTKLPEFGPQSIKKALSLSLESQAEKIDAINLGSPAIQLGDRNSVEPPKAAQFMLFNKPLYTNGNELNIMIFCGNDVNTKPIEDLIYPTAKNFKVGCRIKVTNLNFRDNGYMAAIDRFITDPEGKFGGFNMYWFILPNNLKNQYGKIKKMAMDSPNPKLTQMTVAATLNKKGFNSIITKILLQMASKVGNALWLPKAPTDCGTKTMMIGIDTAADKVQKGTIVAYCASMAKDFSKFHSSYVLQENGKELPEKTGLIITQSVKAFVQENTYYPEEIIVMRNGCADSQISAALEYEVKEVRGAIDRIYGKEGLHANLTYIIVDKNVNQKLFKVMNDGKAANPSFGMLVNSDIVTANYDFYMIAQHCNMGTVKPAYYKVIYNDSKMQEGLLQELIYTQCFNYMNWTGSVRVPACLQYAKKLSSFIAGYVNNEDKSSFPKNLYYI